MATTVSPTELVLIEHVPSQHVITTYRNVAVCYWMSKSTAAQARVLRSTFRTLYEAFEGGFSALHYVSHSVGMPDPDAREIFRQLMPEIAGRLGCTAVILAGGGFWASALSSLITGIHMVSPTKKRTFRIATNLDELKGWFSDQHMQRTSVAIDAAELASIMSHVRSIGGAAGRGKRESAR